MLNTRIKAFVELGVKIKETILHTTEDTSGLSEAQVGFKISIIHARNKNPWFTENSVLTALKGIVEMLKEEDVIEFTSRYIVGLSKTIDSKDVGIIMAGNIPAVGFHDFMCVLLSGHNAICKLSSGDESLLPGIARLLVEIEPSFASKIEFLEAPRKNFDAVIATGSDNSARYFEQYFGKKPNIIRRSRTSLAILDGSETDEQLAGLGKDLFTYFGLGCRNVSKLLLIGDISIERIIEVLTRDVASLDLSKYLNNIDYHKSILMINRVPFLDGGAFLFKEDDRLFSPISITHYERVESMSECELYIKGNLEQIQCIVSPKIKGGVDFGEAQCPKIWDYADKVDTLDFLISL